MGFLICVKTPPPPPPHFKMPPLSFLHPKSPHPTMQSHSPSASITPLDTPRQPGQPLALNPSLTQNALRLAAMPALSQTLAAEAAALSENVSTRELAMRLRMLQRIFRWIHSAPCLKTLDFK